MAMDPRKLKAYVSKGQPELYDEEEEEESESPEHEELESEEHEAAESPEEEAAEHADDELESDEDEGDELESDEDEAEFEDFIGDVYTHAEELEEAALAIDEALNHDTQPSPGVVEEMKSQLGDMPDVVQEGIADFLVGMPYEEVLELAESLAERDRITDAEQVAGWLYWAAKNIEA